MDDLKQDYVVTNEFDTEISGRKAHVEIRSPSGPWTREHTVGLMDYLEYGPVIALDSGRRIKMTSLRQNTAYSSIYEGVPFGPDYQWIIERQKKWAKHAAPKASIVVIEPELAKLPYNDEELDAIRRFFRREPVSIGPVVCKGYFMSEETDENLHASHMIIIWFQKEFMMPMDDWTLSRIKAIDWDTLSIKETNDEYFADL